MTPNGNFCVKLKSVLYVPQTHVNLLYFSSMQNNFYYVLFHNNFCKILRNSYGTCAPSVRIKGIYYKLAYILSDKSYETLKRTI